MTQEFHKLLPLQSWTVTVCAPEFMMLGIRPNIMDRFMLSNPHEVLFVN
jgi:hypothetical protein